jgi:hypothetical protein
MPETNLKARTNSRCSNRARASGDTTASAANDSIAPPVCAAASWP